ncbi:MAG: polysaccharide biosynthesis C-terminal domain-containing protein [Bacteroidia bacterium]|nr:polysaccharide biosynthesis C-terminal domain-containing protein [Bacteroidia bacterium]
MPIGNFTSLKGRRRLLTVAAHAVTSLLVPVFSILISLLVVKMASRELWGGFVEVMIVVNLGAHLLNWGNKEYLLRGFAADPASLARQWQEGMQARLLLLPLGVAALWLVPVCRPFIFPATLWLVAAFLYQSFEVVILFKKWFMRTAVAELVGLGVILSHLWLSGNGWEVEGLVWAFAMGFCAKALLIGVWAGREVQGRVGVARVGHFLQAAFPFFLLGLSGMLQSRTDLYCVALYLGEDDLAAYQVLISMLLYLQALANFVLLPFARNLYRMKTSSIRKMSWSLTGLGLLMLLFAIPAVYLAYVWGFGFEMSLGLLIAGTLFVIPVFAYLPLIYALYKRRETGKVMWVNGIGIGVNLILNLVLLPFWGILGALAASAFAQWMILGLTWWFEKNGTEQN